PPSPPSPPAQRSSAPSPGGRQLRAGGRERSSSGREGAEGRARAGRAAPLLCGPDKAGAPPPAARVSEEKEGSGGLESPGSEADIQRTFMVPREPHSGFSSSAVRYSMVRSGPVRYSMVRSGPVQQGPVQHGPVRYSKLSQFCSPRNVQVFFHLLSGRAGAPLTTRTLEMMLQFTKILKE
ncbi:hypothetical protein D4764_06G0013340, partial [Takifugu flavidus]